MKKVLNEEEIAHAKTLRRQGWTKRKLASHFGVSRTAIWENVFASSKRIRAFKPLIKKIDLRPSCTNCEIRMTRDVRTYHNHPVSLYQVPANFQLGDKCLGCYLAAVGLTHMDLVDR